MGDWVGGCIRHKRETPGSCPLSFHHGPLDSAAPAPAQAPGQAPSCDLPQQAEARCGGWGDGSGERLLFCKPHPLLGVLL